MTTYKRCDESVHKMALGLLEEFSDSYEPLITTRAQVDFVFAYASHDKQGFTKAPALTHHGIRAPGQTRVLPLKDRAMGRGDAEVTLDHDWWADAPDEQRLAVLDHELHHLVVDKTAAGEVKTDDLQRPLLKLRKHDTQVGWFKIIAARHGPASQERMQAASLMDEGGQYFFPGFTEEQQKLEYVKEPSSVKTATEKFVRGIKKSLGPGGSVTISVPHSSIKPVTITGGAAA